MCNVCIVNIACVCLFDRKLNENTWHNETKCRTRLYNSNVEKELMNQRYKQKTESERNSESVVNMYTINEK